MAGLDIDRASTVLLVGFPGLLKTITSRAAPMTTARMLRMPG